MVFDEIKNILADQLTVKESDIKMSSSLSDDLGADSLDAIDIVMSIEDTYEIEVPDEVIEEMETVADIVNYIESQI